MFGIESNKKKKTKRAVDYYTKRTQKITINN